MIVVFKDSSVQVFYVEPFLVSFGVEMEKIRQDIGSNLPGIVVANTKKNVDMLISEWEKIVNFHKKFCIYFVNPFSLRAKQWAIYPATHQVITRGEGLKIGLYSLFNTVDEISIQEFTQKIAEENKLDKQN